MDNNTISRIGEVVTPVPANPSLLRPRRWTLRRWWFARFLGRRNWEVELGDDVLTVRLGTKHTRLHLTGIKSVKCEFGRFSGLVTIQGSNISGKLVRLSSLLKADARLIAAELTRQRFAGQIEAVFHDFDRLLESHGYLNHRRVNDWLERYKGLNSAIVALQELVFDTDATDLMKTRELFMNYEQLIDKRNARYVADTAHRLAAFFEKFEKNPLTNRQVEAVVRDEDHTLVVAGAGTGKTSTIVGKIGYLLHTGEVEPNEILALAFVRKAAEEMRERVKDCTENDVEIRTFHSLGLKIVSNVEDEKPAIASIASHEKELLAWISQCINEMLSEESPRQRFLKFAIYHRYPVRYLEDFANRGEYLKYLRKHEPQTIRGEMVKSFEELLIADWLTLNGVVYEYEHPYKYKTASRKRRQYKPDFFFPEYDIYLEHFGIDRKGRTAPGIDGERYAAGMDWKRKIHRSAGTTLIETYSWERMEGVLLDSLKRKLIAAGVSLRPLTEDELRSVIEHPGVKPRIVALLGDFLPVFKENLWTQSELHKNAEGSTDPVRAQAFIDLFEDIYQRYQKRLEDRQELDFADLISRATKYVKSNAFMSPFRRIVVDEFQDISRGRQRLLLALLRQNNEDVRVFCVGDDWQSIFGFTGSDIGIMTTFSEAFGFTARVDLDRTFRFNMALLNASSRFVQANPAQISKVLHSKENIEGPVIHIIWTREPDVAHALRIIDRDRITQKRASVLLLGRYNHVEPDHWEKEAQSFRMLDVQFLTVHKAKGLEADYVVVLDVKSGRLGFPSEIASDPLMDLVIPSDHSYLYAEERRVFYVALSRARRRVYLMADPTRPSTFVSELLESSYTGAVVSDGKKAVTDIGCPECLAGRLVLARPNRKMGYAWLCTSSPYCDGSAKMCQICESSPVSPQSRDDFCLNPSCDSRKGTQSGPKKPVRQPKIKNPGPKPNTKLISIGNNLFYCLSCKKETTSAHQC